MTSTDIYKNVYGDTLRSIITDFNTQVKDLESIKRIEKEDREKLEFLKNERDIAFKIYNEYYTNTLKL